MADTIGPVVTLNGTSRDVLIAQRCDAGRTLQTAMDALSETAPHPRDYPNCSNLFHLAEARHGRRMQMLRNLREELEDEIRTLDGE